MLTAALVAAFVALMIAMGIVGMRRTSTLNDFFLGGRSIGPWISALTFGTSYFSAVLFIGFAGKLGWGFGLDVLWIAAGNTVFGSLLSWLVLGRRTRRMTQNLDAMTMPEFFHARFEGRGVKLLAAGVIFLFLLPYSASVYKGLGHLFEVNFGISYDTALIAMTLITGLYLVLGGYFAIALTDCVQGVIMVIGSVAMVSVLVGRGGGLGAVLTAIAENYPQHVPPARQPDWVLLASLVFMTSFGTWGLPQMVQKFYAIRDERTIGRAAVVTTLFALIVVFAAYFNGALCHVFFDELPLVDGRPAFDRLIPDLLRQQLPASLMALILLLILSASMSTLSSLVLVSSSAVAIDIYKGHVNPAISRARAVGMMRGLSALFVLVSFLIARREVALIVTLMSLSWGVVAGAFMAPLVYGLYWRRTTLWGVLAGMLAAIAVDLYLFFHWGPERSPVAATVAMLTPFVVIPVVSLLTRPPSPERLAAAFAGIGGRSA